MPTLRPLPREVQKLSRMKRSMARRKNRPVQVGVLEFPHPHAGRRCFFRARQFLCAGRSNLPEESSKVAMRRHHRGPLAQHRCHGVPSGGRI